MVIVFTKITGFIYKNAKLFQCLVTSVTFVKKWQGTSPPWMDLGLTTSPNEISDFVANSICKITLHRNLQLEPTVFSLETVQRVMLLRKGYDTPCSNAVPWLIRNRNAPLIKGNFSRIRI